MCYLLNNTNIYKYSNINYLYMSLTELPYLSSETLFIKMGVPQGSILRPLLFQIYINYLQSAIDMFIILIYADDTTLFCNFDNSCNEEVINAELNNVCSCLCSNRLYLNKGKTKYVSFHTAKNK